MILGLTAATAATISTVLTFVGVAGNCCTLISQIAIDNKSKNDSAIKVKK